MQKKIFATAALTFGLAVVAWAQTTTPPTPPTPAQIVANQVARLTKLLDLTNYSAANRGH